MKEEKKKKIRTQLINFINQELQNTKNKKSKFLINSMTLEQLEKKNMQCKDFRIEEKEQIYHNIDNGWIIGLNIYINNSSNYNPFIYSLSNIIKDNYIINDIKNKNDININQMDDIYNNKETIIQKQSNKILFIQKEGKGGSPVNTSLLIKKEVGERKLKRTNHEFNSNKMPINRSELSLNKKENEKEIDIGKDVNFNNNINIVNDIDDNNLLITKQLSKETLETEISRIIKICYDEKYTNSFEHFPSDNKISELSKEISIAKMYAKKLKIYCRTLKRKNPISNESIKREISKDNNKNNYMKIYEVKNKNIKNEKENISKKNNVLEDKNIKNKKLKKNQSLLINLKKNIEKEKEDVDQLENSKPPKPHKKINSERNIKLKIKRDSFLKIIKAIKNDKNNNNTISSTNKQYRTLEQKGNEKRRSHFNFKLNKKIRKKTFEQEYKSKQCLKTKKELNKLIKSPPKIIRNKKTKENKKLNKNTKTSKDLYIMTESSKNLTNLIKKKKKKFDDVLKNKILTEINKENNSKKIIKYKKNLEDSNKKKSSNIIKNIHKKRGSVDQKHNISGFEKLNFIKAKHKSTKEQLLFTNKKVIKRRNKLNNNNTSVSQQRDSSPSIEKIKKFIKSNNRIKNSKKISNSELQFRDKKKKTVAVLKTRRSSIIEALKKMKKRKSTNYNEIKVFGGKAMLSPIRNEDKRPCDTIIDGNKKIENKKIKNKTNRDVKDQKNNEIFNDNKETDIFNILDEFLYKKKQERGKKCI